jgi:tetratricopeptide (TPR) repeat protein
VLTFVLYQAGTLGRSREAAELAKRVEPLAERLGHLGATFLVIADRIRTQGVMGGDLSAIESMASQAIDICERGGLPWLYVGHMYLGLAAHWRGAWDQAEGHLRTAAEMEPPAAFAGQSASLLAVHLAHAGRAEEVLEIAEGLRGILPVDGRVNSIGAWNTLFTLTEALYEIGRKDEAASFYPLIAEALDKGFDWITFNCRLIRTRAGIAAAAAGRFDEAEQHYESALKVAESAPNRIETADILRFYARMLLDRADPGDREKANEQGARAINEYADIGMPKHVEMVESMLRGHG